MSFLSNKLFNLRSYGYDLPEALIAQVPLADRDKARLLIVDRKKGRISHDTFEGVSNYLPAHAQLVVNNSKVIPARLWGRRSSGGAVEVFLLNRHDDNAYEVLVRPLKKIREGEVIYFDGGFTGVLEDRQTRLVRFNKKNILRHLQKIGHIPLPPYIKRPDTFEDRADYQTVYARQAGSVAAPTAGLHFTKRLISALKKQGHQFLELTLHINYGTFKPVECDDIRQHPMHSEFYSISPKVASLPGPLVAVGTTSCRVLESVARSHVYSGSTDIFIYPGHEFKSVDALITNFHLPYSTLLMLVCAFGGYDLIMKAYHEAIKERYRFYSYGDAMLII